MNSTPKVSIIVPVYNVEKYIENCVYSLINQSFQEIEIILVDDGSPDRSGELAEQLARDDDRIKVFHKENGGVTLARAYGLERASGEWIVFLDSDDSLPCDAIEYLYGRAVEKNYDVVLGTWLRITPNGQRKGWISCHGAITGAYYLRSLLSGKVPTGPWAKIYRKAVLLGDVMDIPSDITNNEDLIMNIRVAKRATRIGVFPNKVVYNYYLREHSASLNKLTWQQWDRIFDVLRDSLPLKYEKAFLAYVVGIMRFRKNDTDFTKSRYFTLCNEKSALFSRLGRYNADLRYLKSATFLNRMMSNFWIMLRKGRKFLTCSLFRYYK